jgi:hypothetical protein
MMKPENRAYEAIEPDWFNSGMAYDFAVDAVAIAIRAAENDALERAGAIVVHGVEDERGNIDRRPGTLLEAIYALKHV